MKFPRTSRILNSAKHRKDKTMKKIIKGKQYDTETATALGCFRKGAKGDLNYMREELFRKKTGEYFLYGKGGASTKYSVLVQNNTWSGSEKIIPLEFSDAQAWAEQNLKDDEYKSIFGEVTEDDESEVVTARVSASTLAKLQRHQSISGETIGTIVEKAIENYIK